MPYFTRLTYSFGIVASIIFFNPGACARACRTSSREAAEHSDEVAKGCTKAKKASTHQAPSTATVDNAAHDGGQFARNSDGSFRYQNRRYETLQEVPFQPRDEVFMENGPTAEEAAHLMQKGVRFVFNDELYLQQRNKEFRIIFLISEDIEVIKTLYEVDETLAERVLTMMEPIMNEGNIQRVSSVDDMFSAQEMAIRTGKVPILVFHNSEAIAADTRFVREANLITCNSFKINPDSYLTSTELLDLNSVVKSILSGKDQASVEAFYKNFTSTYYTEISKTEKQTMLYLAAGGIGGAGSITVYAYYKNNQND